MTPLNLLFVPFIYFTWNKICIFFYVSLESTDGSDRISYLHSLLEMATIYIRNVESDSEDIYMIITDMIY